MKEFLSSIPSFYNNKAADIVFSRDNKLVNESIYGNVCLIGVKISNVYIEDYIYFPINIFYVYIAILNQCLYYIVAMIRRAIINNYPFKVLKYRVVDGIIGSLK